VFISFSNHLFKTIYTPPERQPPDIGVFHQVAEAFEPSGEAGENFRGFFKALQKKMTLHKATEKRLKVRNY